MRGQQVTEASILSFSGVVLAKVVTRMISANSPMTRSCRFNSRCQGFGGQNCRFNDRCQSYRFNDLCQGSNAGADVQMSNVGSSITGDTIPTIDAEGPIIEVVIPATDASCHSNP